MLAEINDGSLINMAGDSLEYSFAVALKNSRRLLFDKSKLPELIKVSFYWIAAVGIAIA